MNQNMMKEMRRKKKKKERGKREPEKAEHYFGESSELHYLCKDNSLQR